MSSLTFSQMPLNRCSSERKDHQWVNAQLGHASTVFIVHWHGRLLFKAQTLQLLSVHSLPKFELNLSDIAIFLGQDQSRSWFMIELSSFDEARLMSYFCEQSQMMDFRASLPLLESHHIAIAGYGNALCHWHRHSLYCGKCGSATSLKEGGHMRLCQDDSCNNQIFPRTDPAVIMLVTYQPEQGDEVCLLATHHRLKNKVYSTLAGFVDPGESIEEAVKREVLEEAGVAVNSVSYFASQPWPFPGSLMIGCRAQTNDPKLNIDYDEISGACWFTAKEVRTFGEWGDEGDGNKLPRKESIARTLIDDWLASQP